MEAGKCGDELLRDCGCENVFGDGRGKGWRGNALQKKDAGLMTSLHVVFVEIGKEEIDRRKRKAVWLRKPLFQGIQPGIDQCLRNELHSIEGAGHQIVVVHTVHRDPIVQLELVYNCFE